MAKCYANDKGVTNQIASPKAPRILSKAEQPFEAGATREVRRAPFGAAEEA